MKPNESALECVCSVLCCFVGLSCVGPWPPPPVTCKKTTGGVFTIPPATPLGEARGTANKLAARALKAPRVCGTVAAALLAELLAALRLASVPTAGAPCTCELSYPLLKSRLFVGIDDSERSLLDDDVIASTVLRQGLQIPTGVRLITSFLMELSFESMDLYGPNVRTLGG